MYVSTAATPNDEAHQRRRLSGCRSPVMLYCSTRGGVRGRSFRDALFSGFAPDGGMFMPETLPVLGRDTLKAWRRLSYTQLVVEVASLFIPTQLIPRPDLEGETLRYCLQIHTRYITVAISSHGTVTGSPPSFSRSQSWSVKPCLGSRWPRW